MQFLEDKVFRRVTTLSPDVERVEVFSNRKETDNRNLVWRGASVVANVETSRDFWVLRSDYEAAGSRALKDKAPFVL